jgi:hypothetical protein
LDKLFGSEHWTSLGLASDGALTVHTRSKGAQVGLHISDLVFAHNGIKLVAYADMVALGDVPIRLETDDMVGCVYSPGGSMLLDGNGILKALMKGDIRINGGNGDIIEPRLWLDSIGTTWLPVAANGLFEGDITRAVGLAFRLGNGIYEVRSSRSPRILHEGAIPAAQIRTYLIDEGYHHQSMIDMTSVDFWIGETVDAVGLYGINAILDPHILVGDLRMNVTMQRLAHLNSLLIDGGGTFGWPIRTEEARIGGDRRFDREYPRWIVMYFYQDIERRDKQKRHPPRRFQE